MSIRGGKMADVGVAFCGLDQTNEVSADDRKLRSPTEMLSRLSGLGRLARSELAGAVRT